MSQSDSPRKLFVVGTGSFLLMILAPVVLVAVFMGFGGSMGSMDAGLEPGTPAPAIVASGWLNGAEPAPEAFQGKVVVVEAWASW